MLFTSASAAEVPGSQARESAGVIVNPVTSASAQVQPVRKKSLHLGMPAAEVAALIGKPHEVAPMASTEAGPAEIWIYRRLKDSKLDWVHMGDKQVTEPHQDAVGRVYNVVVATEAIMKNRRRDTFEVLQILMVNGQYVNMKKTLETKEVYL